MKALYKMEIDLDRRGILEGLFIAEMAEIDYLIENKIIVQFGEVLGKHSDIRGSLDQQDIQIITQDIVIINFFEENKLSCGYNPLDYIFCKCCTRNISVFSLQCCDECKKTCNICELDNCIIF